MHDPLKGFLFLSPQGNYFPNVLLLFVNLEHLTLVPL